MSKAKFIAQSVAEKALEAGARLSIRNNILSIESNYDANKFNDINEWFRFCDCIVTGILYEVPQTSAGSMWGTDGGSVGGLSALQSGTFKMNRSGCSVRVLNALKKLL